MSSTTTDTLIASLADDMKAVKPAAHPVTLLAKWLVVSLCYMSVLLCFSGLRPDLADQLHRPAYAAEVSLLLLIVLTCGISAVMLSFPDMYQKRWVTFTPAVPLLMFVGLMIAEYLQETPLPKPPHGFECLLSIGFYSLVPALSMMLLLRNQASTHYNTAGGTALLASASMGCFALRLCEETNSIIHLVTWHYLPILGFALAGVWLGQKILKW